MLEINIPGFRMLRLKNLVIDFNGTASFDGTLLPGVASRLSAINSKLSLFVITSDTFGTAAEQIGDIATLKILNSSHHRSEKHSFVASLGADSVVAIGNGSNDASMLEAASLGIAVCQQEGASSEALRVADLVCPDVMSALELLLHPNRLIATLRS